MNDPFAFPGSLHSPHFIFVKCAGMFSDRDLLHHFGLSHYRHVDAVPVHQPYVMMADDGEWLLLAEDWYYVLWNMATYRPALEVLAKYFEIYAFSQGDSDYFYDFIYYKEGVKLRKFVNEDPNYDGGQVVVDIGPAMRGEVRLAKSKEPKAMLLNMASALGVGIRYDRIHFRLYS